MTRNILLPTDFSRNAWFSILYALKLYENEPCNFYVLNVFSATINLIGDILDIELGDDLYEEAKLRSVNGLAKVMDMIAFAEDGKTIHHFTPLSVFDDPLDGIKKVVEDKDIEMIIMGTKGESNSIGVIYGSNAINVMEKVRNCPVIVVPENAKQTLPKEIVFPTSYKTHFKRSVLNPLVEVTKICGATIRVLHVAQETELSTKQIENKKILEDCLEGIIYSYHSLSSMDIPTAIYCFMESRDSDMVAFINKKHALFGSLLTQPLVKEITLKSKVPVLVMHDLRN